MSALYIVEYARATTSSIYQLITPVLRAKLRTDDIVVLQCNDAREFHFAIWLTDRPASRIALSTPTLHIPLECTRRYANSMHQFKVVTDYCVQHSVPMRMELLRSDSWMQRFEFDRSIWCIDLHFTASVATPWIATARFSTDRSPCIEFDPFTFGSDLDKTKDLLRQQVRFVCTPQRQVLIGAQTAMTREQLERIRTIRVLARTSARTFRVPEFASLSGTIYMYSLFVYCRDDNTTSLRALIADVLQGTPHVVLVSEPDRLFVGGYTEPPNVSLSQPWDVTAPARVPFQHASVVALVLAVGGALVPHAVFEIVEWLSRFHCWTRFQLVTLIEATYKSINRLRSRSGPVRSASKRQRRVKVRE